MVKMMSKIVQAVNAMITNPRFITEVKEGGGEIFFLYKEKYAWSMKDDRAVKHLWYYPGNHSIDYLVDCARSEMSWDGITMVHYNDGEIGTKEAKASFAELFTMLKERVYGVNDVLNDIISDLDDTDSPPF